MMRNIEHIINSKNILVGLLGSNHTKLDYQYCREFLGKYLNNDYGMVCFHSIGQQKYSIKYLRSIQEFNAEYLIQEGKFVLMEMEDAQLKGCMDICLFLRLIEKGIDMLNEKNSHNNQVCFAIDASWNAVKSKDLAYLYEQLLTISKEGRAGFIIRYVMPGLSKHLTNCLLNYHNFALVDTMDSYEYYAIDELIYESLVFMTEHYGLQNNYEKTLQRGEHLKTIGELTEGFIHDINNLLVTILGYAQLSLHIGDVEYIKDYLQIICKTALDGKMITDRIRNHIRGSYESIMDVYEFDYIINNCIEMVKHKFKSSDSMNNNIELIAELNSKAYIYANEYDIRHSVANIILNGVDAMEKGGTISVKTSYDGKKIILEISDTGKGMDEQVKEKLFMPYFTTKGPNGTGLGLSIVKKTIDKHNGKIYIESRLGEGTVFTIHFPALRTNKDIAHTDDNGYNIN